MRNVIYAINLTLDGCCDHTKFGSERESGKLCILRGFLKNEEFSLGCG